MTSKTRVRQQAREDQTTPLIGKSDLCLRSPHSKQPTASVYSGGPKKNYYVNGHKRTVPLVAVYIALMGSREKNLSLTLQGRTRCERDANGISLKYYADSVYTPQKTHCPVLVFRVPQPLHNVFTRVHTISLAERRLITVT